MIPIIRLFTFAIPIVDRLISRGMTVSTGVSAMRSEHSGGEKPNVRRKYLSPDEARRVIEASARTGRQAERDKPLLTLIYRHGLRGSEAGDLRWTDFDLDAPKARPFMCGVSRAARTACIRSNLTRRGC